MIEDAIDASEKKFLLRKITFGMLLGLFLLMIPFVIAIGLDLEHLSDSLPFVLLGYVLAGIWFYFLIFLIVKAIVFYGYIFGGKVKKITTEFVVIDKEITTTTFDGGSDSQWFYLQLSAEKITQRFCLEVGSQDYAVIQKGDLLALEYYSRFNHLLNAKYLGRELQKARLDVKTRFNLVSSLRHKFRI